MILQQFGIIERPSYVFEGYSEAGYTAITTGIEKGKSDVYASLKNPKNYETDLPKLLRIKLLYGSKKLFG